MFTFVTVAAMGLLWLPVVGWVLLGALGLIILFTIIKERRGNRS